jgi:hypothetical protein
VNEDGTTPLWKGYRGLFTRVPRRKILCGLEISLRENATTHNYTPQKLPHTNSPIAHYHQSSNGNPNHTKKACSITYQAGKSVGNTLPICRIDVGTRKTLSMRRATRTSQDV